MSKSNYDLLIAKLDQFIRKYYTNKLIRGSIYALSILLFSYLLFAIMEYYGNYGVLSRTLLFYVFVSTAALVCIKMILIPLFKLYKLGKVISHEQAALIIGKHFKNVEDKLFNILQLKKQSDLHSSELLLAGINQKIAALKPVPFTDAIDLKSNRKYAKYLYFPLGILLLLLLFSPNILKEGTSRLVAHTTEFVPMAPFSFIIENDKLSGIRNEDYLLKLRIHGEEVPNNVFLELGNERFLMKKLSNSRFSFSFNNLQEDIDFRFSADGFNSIQHTLKALPKPILVNFTIDADYPSYTGKEDESIQNFGDLNVPQGTHLKWTFNTKDTEELIFIFQDSLYTLPKSAENEFSFSTRVFKSGNYKLTTKNDFVADSDTIDYMLNVSPDLYPSIEVEKKIDSVDNKQIYFKGFVKDDYGFSRLIFHYQFFSSDGLQSVPEKLELSFNKNMRQSEFFHFWDLRRQPIAAGDKLEYYFEVWDNDGVNGSKSARTHKMEYKAPSLRELAQMAEKSNQSVKSELEENIALTRDIQKELAELNQKVLEKKKLGWQEKKKMEDILKKQSQVKESIQKLQEQNERMNKEKSSFTEVDEQILEKQKMLEEMFDKLMSEEMKKLMEEMQQLMEEMNKDKLKNAIEEMELSNEDLEKELDRNLELFKQLEYEQKLNETKDKLDQLKEKQSELADKSKEKSTDADSLKQEQDKLNKEFDELKEDMEDLKKKNSKLEQPNKMENTDELAEETQKEMQESSDQLEEKEKSKASESQSEAEKKMEELSKKLGSMQMSMKGGASPENMEDLRALLENLLSLSFDQESLMKELEQTDRNDPKYVKLSQQQRKLKDDSKMIEDSLFALSKRVMQIQPAVNKEINLINNNMDKALADLGERRTSNAIARQQLAMTSANNLALLLDQALQQMQQLMQKGEGSCPKPGQGKPSLSDMKKMQEQLNKQLQQMKDGMKKGQKPGDKEGEGEAKGGKGGMSKELAKMAAKQAAIRRELDRMQEQLGKEGEGGAGKGNLKKLSELMEETEVDLVNKRINQETINRQKEILTRLLESEKADREREKDEKRESNEANDELTRNPNLFFEYNRQKEKEIELLKTLPPGFNIFYKNKVSEYLNQVER